jgi:hypothetical protein
MTDPQPDLSPLARRIAERLKVVGLSERQASMKAFGNIGAIRNVRTGASKHPGIDFCETLAPLLGVTPQWLAFGAGEEAAEPAPAPTIPIVGEVAAGTWRSVDTAVDEPDFGDTRLPADPEWPVEAQVAFRVRGTSINRVAPDGFFLGCVDIHRVQYRPQRGDLLVIERQSGDGSQIERTVKRLRVDARGERSLIPDSTDPDHQDAIPLSRGDGDETETVRVLALVTWVHSPVWRETGR